VAIDAKRHLDGTIRFGKRGRHFGHVPVAREAGDFSDRHMPPVGKICVIGHPVNLYPWDGLVFLYIIHQFFLFFALRHRLFMAAFADPDVRDRGLFMGLRSGVAVEAVQAGVFNVFLVVIQDGLCMIYAFRTATCEYNTEDRETYGEWDRTLSHESSMGLRSFLFFR
jgi:hypothetical protein